MQAVGPVCRVVDGIDRGEAWIRNSLVKVKAVFQRNIGETIGIKVEVAGDRGVADLAAPGDRIHSVIDFVDSTLMIGVESGEGAEHRRAGQVGIAGSRSPWIIGVVLAGQG